MYIVFIFLQKQISPAPSAHRTVKTQKGGCPGWQPGMRGWTPLTCLCWELRVTPETTAHLPAASSMASVTQVKVRQMRCDGVTFEKRSQVFFVASLLCLAHLGLHGVTHMNTIGKQTHWTCTIGNFTQIKVIFNLYGFSATARAVHRVLEQRYHGNPWHSTKLLTTQLLSWTLKRINEASGMYQMVGVLGDVIVLRG